mmetsp:Transcript_26664/g.69996  ORF Transcript_26664/g.69996 Transcript_26664/m.69996 type:complete len:249 (+) Transcript_26664:122-868(+)
MLGGQHPPPPAPLPAGPFPPIGPPFTESNLAAPSSRRHPMCPGRQAWVARRARRPKRVASIPLIMPRRRSSAVHSRTHAGREASHARQGARRPPPVQPAQRRPPARRCHSPGHVRPSHRRTLIRPEVPSPPRLASHARHDAGRVRHAARRVLRTPRVARLLALLDLLEPPLVLQLLLQVLVELGQEIRHHKLQRLQPRRLVLVRRELERHLERLAGDNDARVLLDAGTSLRKSPIIGIRANADRADLV